ncbi:hypothetical protein HK102_013853 [Quaeritorhiza haematococci]|nr:hypothetical protein HK102_013853 [Quaeritorhiza haematococci]
MARLNLNRSARCCLALTILYTAVIIAIFTNSIIARPAGPAPEFLPEFDAVISNDVAPNGEIDEIPSTMTATASLEFATATMTSPLFTSTATATPATPAGSASSPVVMVEGKWFDRVMIVVFENYDYEDALKVPYLADLHKNGRGQLLTDYRGIWHPSQPNYLGMVFGDIPTRMKLTLGFINGDRTVSMEGRNLVDLLEERGVSWKAYQQGYQRRLIRNEAGEVVGDACNPDDKIGRYRRKHNPFMSMENIRENPTRCAKIVEADELFEDIAANRAPQFIFYTPDMDNDAHDQPLSWAVDNWFKKFSQAVMFPNTGAGATVRGGATSASSATEGWNKAVTEFMKNTLVVVTFDESKTLYHNHIATWLIGPPAAEGVRVAEEEASAATTAADPTGGEEEVSDDDDADSQGYQPVSNSEDGPISPIKYNHYSLLRTIEENWNLGTLGRKDEKAIPFLTLKKPKDGYGMYNFAPPETP